jgi:DNA-directed RNA polymerase specialized sigma24 family protein
MAKEPSTSLFLRRLKARDPSAVQALWELYFRRLSERARGYIRSLHLPFDEESVALSAIASNVFRFEQGKFPYIDDRAKLWGLLWRIAQRKVVRRLRTKIQKEELLLDDLVRPGSGHGEALERICGAMPDEVDFVGLLRELMDGLAPRRRRVLELILKGEHYNQIARTLGVAEVTVSRDVAIIKQSIEKLGREDSDEGRASGAEDVDDARVRPGARGHDRVETVRECG